MAPLPADSHLAEPGQVLGSVHSRQVSQRTRSGGRQGGASRELSHCCCVMCARKSLQYLPDVLHPSTWASNSFPPLQMIENCRL